MTPRPRSSAAADRLESVWDNSWPAPVKKMMRELADIGVEFEQATARRAEVSRRRTELFQALDTLVPHRVMAKAGGSTKGAVEQALWKARRRG
jgi:hypothetical protein